MVLVQLLVLVKLLVLVQLIVLVQIIYLKNIIDVVSKHITRKKEFTENILDKSIITQKKHWNKKSKKKLNEILKRYLEKN